MNTKKMKQLQNSFTSFEQSKRLLELGVPVNSADCYIDGAGCPNIVIGKATECLRDYNPCWSAGRLIEIFEICCPKYYFATDVEYDKGIIEQLIRDLQIYNADFSKLQD